MAGTAGAAMLCYVTPKEHLGPAGRGRRERRASSPTRSPPTPRTSRATARARATATTRSSRARYAFDWKEQFRALARPRDRAGDARRDAPGRVLQDRGVLLDVRPEVLHMHINRAVEEFNEQVEAGQEGAASARSTCSRTRSRRVRRSADPRGSSPRWAAARALRRARPRRPPAPRKRSRCRGAGCRRTTTGAAQWGDGARPVDGRERAGCASQTWSAA